MNITQQQDAIRPKMGRPRAEEQAVSKSFRVKTTLYEMVEKESEKTGNTMSSIVNKALEKYFGV